jgi:hypothetical protein
VPLWNPVSLVRWNAHKRYLADLARLGVFTPPTMFVSAGDRRSLDAVLREAGWAEAVVKPAVSASAYDTFRVSLEDAHTRRRQFQEMTARGDVIVQPLLRVLLTDGEWSLIFIDGAFSHAVLKTPRTGDFLAQEVHGGHVVSMRPPQSVVDAAAFALQRAPGSALYARVDGCVVEHRFCLMELELIEPTLFFRVDAGAAGWLAERIISLTNVGL